jgi:hypothetical protein
MVADTEGEFGTALPGDGQRKTAGYCVRILSGGQVIGELNRWIAVLPAASQAGL